MKESTKILLNIYYPIYWIFTIIFMVFCCPLIGWTGFILLPFFGYVYTEELRISFLLFALEWYIVFQSIYLNKYYNQLYNEKEINK